LWRYSSREQRAIRAIQQCGGTVIEGPKEYGGRGVILPIGSEASHNPRLALSHLSYLNNVTAIIANGSQFSATGSKFIICFDTLCVLEVAGSPLSDAGLAFMKSCALISGNWSFHPLKSLMPA
jgi:hypothetical protein